MRQGRLVTANGSTAGFHALDGDRWLAWFYGYMMLHGYSV